MTFSDKLLILQDRAKMLAAARNFFYSRGVMEVDCPLITQAASVDLHIDLIPTTHQEGGRFLHSSPEYGMKRLLAHGIGDIYQLAHVFRQEEFGKKHNPEFMMAEWYRLGFTFNEMIDETLSFMHLLLGPLPSEVISYRQALIQYAGIDYVGKSNEELYRFIQDNQLGVYDGLKEEGCDALLNVILSNMVEPFLGKDGLCVLAYYPASQSALAQIRWHGDECVAERFEIYHQGIELCNGYHELADANEQRSRLLEANEQRIHHGKKPLPIDEAFLKALEQGLPPCCGVAVGFDRLMMLRHSKQDIVEVIPFGWLEA